MTSERYPIGWDVDLGDEPRGSNGRPCRVADGNQTVRDPNIVMGTPVEPVHLELVESSRLPDVFVREAVPPLFGWRVSHCHPLWETRKQ